MKLKSIVVIERVGRKLAPGQAPFFMGVHVVKALETIEAEGPIGRVKLSKTLGLGGGAIRTLVKHLETERMIKISRTGIVLSDCGKKLFLDLKSRISKEIEVPESSLTIGSCNVAILVKDAANFVKHGLEQRDAAIKIGALGATTLVFSHGKLNMPGIEEDAFKGDPPIRVELVSKFQPQENDVVIIGSANDKLTAEYGAIAAALETLKARVKMKRSNESRS
jgi:predicted transcriptional regulator